MQNEVLKKMILPTEIQAIAKKGRSEIIIPNNREELIELALGGAGNMQFDVNYEIPEKGTIREAVVTRCKNGIVVNFDDPYMRRRDPDSMIIADDLPTDKVTHEAQFGKSFDSIREETFEWLKNQDALIFMPFLSGGTESGLGYPSLLVVPANAAFFALAVLDLQGFIPADKIPSFFKPKAIVYVAPPFRHTHYDGKQVVIHNRIFEMHEVFSYNLYPGPSAKKGIYGVLLNIGEQEKWVTLHASAVRIVTPYELMLTIMHEGASGGGKSEMIGAVHRQANGRLLLATNIVTGEDFHVNMSDTSELFPITDDMALAHPSMRNDSKKLVIADAETGWFTRVNHIEKYGTEPDIERNTIHPKQPLLFFNIEAVPGSTALIWEPIMDSPTKPCSNPRVIIPRNFVNNCLHGPHEIDIRSFGIRTPPTTKEKPNYGIIGMFHLLPPALAWLWRLVAPRGYANPSIIDSGDMQSEGVGSYWPFATGKMIVHANLLLEQIVRTHATKNVLIPNQHIGAYYVGFAGQWAVREYLSRRGGANFRPDVLVESKCPILGYALDRMKIDGTNISKRFLQVNLQQEVGEEGYAAGSKMLMEFFGQELLKYMTPELDPRGKNIIDAFYQNATIDDYLKLM